MTSYALDTTSLIALQRDPARATALADAASESGSTIRVSAVTLAEFLGGSTRRTRHGADHVSSLLDVGIVDERLARRAAELERAVADARGRVRPGPIDALVIADAEAIEASVIIDGDRAAFSALARASGQVQVVELSKVA